MVSFSCEHKACGDVLTKKKLDPHLRQCPNASYTCLDCMVNFQRNDYRFHTSCISEAQKYQGALYRSEGEKKPRRNTTVASSPNEEKTQQSSRKSKTPSPMRDISMPPPVDATVKHSEVNVFDFLVPEESQDSHISRRPQHDSGKAALNHVVTSEVLREIQYSFGQNLSSRAPSSTPNSGDAVKLKSSKTSAAKQSPISRQLSVSKQTPVSKKNREGCREKRDCSAEFKQAKRKRLHVETRDLVRVDEDETMIDVSATNPHSDLTGGFKQLMTRTPALPLNPDYAGAKPCGSASPNSPLKKTKHARKQGRPAVASNGFMAFMTGTKPPPNSLDRCRQKKKVNSSDCQIADLSNGGDLVVYKPESLSADLLFSLIDRGLQSSRGISMKRALRKFHREREIRNPGSSRAADENELLSLLRLKRNNRGEVVLTYE
ncbi:hypothetical protein GcC1_219018 [Golovinomyces cichoracearum]|uniref:Zinc finger C2H2 LYAR-type domain-containing protein n=1 Tax=Golovinomyces cichoracearum TaxID=62708 RepID=A0A420H8D6_9PEZI|nr:hypothetical protein GcC1_219018 [Golovinomyces cichoracearum]